MSDADNQVGGSGDPFSQRDQGGKTGEGDTERQEPPEEDEVPERQKPEGHR